MRAGKGLILFLLCLGGTITHLSAAEGITSITILTFSGKVEIARRPDVWDPGHTNQVLRVGDRLRTGKNSRATIRLSDGTTIQVGAEANLQVPEQKKGVTVNPLSGLFYIFHRDRRGELELRNQSAVAAVRGTEFHVEAREDGVWILSVIDGEVDIESGGRQLSLKTGDAGEVGLGVLPHQVPIREAVDLIQWCFYYPAVLDPNELEFSPEEQAALKNSLDAYRNGDLSVALEIYPADRQPASDSERLYRAALALAAGQVPDAEGLLASADNAIQARVLSLRSALVELIAVVKARPRTQTAPVEINSSSRWLAESYRLQSESDLKGALKAVRRAVELSPEFGFGWARVAELEFSFGRTGATQDALAHALRLSPRNAQAITLQGFVLAAKNRIDDALTTFNEAISVDGSLANAWLGRGLCRIRRGQNQQGRHDLLVAATLEPQRSLLRSYLGKAFALNQEDVLALKEFDLARSLDSHDPTPWLYSALLLQQGNRINEAIDHLQNSIERNDNRSLFRSRLMLDQDGAVRSANLARIYADAGMNEVGFNEAAKAVSADYANFSSHLFLAESFNALRDPRQINLRYETAWLNEYLIANLLAPPGAGALSHQVSQHEYARLFEQDRIRFGSLTEYGSRGDWLQSAVQEGVVGNSAYAAEMTYRTENGFRPNNDFEQLTLSLRWKQQLSQQDSVYLQTIYYDAEGGDIAPLYNQSMANSTLRVKEKQEPIVLAGYHREWSPGIHTLVLAGRLHDTLQVTNGNLATVFFNSFLGQIQSASLAQYEQAYESEQVIYLAEAQQLFQRDQHTFVVGTRFQTGEFETRNDIDNGFTVPGGTPVDPIRGQDAESDFHRLGAYGYYHWKPIDSLVLIGGVAYDRITFPVNHRFAPVSNAEDTRDLVGPKAGLVWAPSGSTTFRAGYAKSLGGVSIDQSFRLEPSQVAGFNQAFRSLIPEAAAGSTAAPEFEHFGVALEQRFKSRTYLSLAGGIARSDVHRALGVVEFQPPSRATTTREFIDFDERTLSITLNQLVGDELSFGAAYRLSHAELERRLPDIPTSAIVVAPLRLQQNEEAILHQVQLFGIVNYPSGLFFRFESIWNQQSNRGYTPDLPGDDFWQFNAFAGYRFWRRKAELTLGLLNFTDQDYQLNPLNLTSEFPHERTLALRFRFSF
jgi:outer membrane receptor protein involved in Fe transport/Tfp pilus assembly protein PilF/mannose-6-phosphate isomerase-like protein (cupin superfamily)